jgi:uncharacterized protein (TIGR03086 family)
MGRQVLANVRPDQLGHPTPCTEYDVRALTGHLVAVLQRVAIVGAGGDPFTAPEYATGVADDGWVAAYDAFAADIERVWSDDAVLGRMCTLPWAQLPGFATLSIYVNEVTVHTWDLAQATGQQPAWDEAVLATAFAAMQQGLPAEGRAATFAEVKALMPVEHQRVGDPFAEAVPVAADAPLIDRLVAWNGRRP